MLDLESIIARHCASTLMALKPASLICFPLAKVNLDLEIKQYLMARPKHLQDIEIKLLAINSRVQYLLLYRKSLLDKWLQEEEVKQTLLRFNYVLGSTEFLLNQLAERLSDVTNKFPHEIGIFLGYPVADVVEFITCGGQNFLTSGYWKVYHNQEVAESKFAEFNACRDCLLRQLKEGSRLWDLCPSCTA